MPAQTWEPVYCALFIMTLYLGARPLQIGCMQPLTRCSLTCPLLLSVIWHNKSKQAVTVLTKSSFWPAVKFVSNCYFKTHLTNKAQHTYFTQYFSNMKSYLPVSVLNTQLHCAVMSNLTLALLWLLCGNKTISLKTAYYGFWRSALLMRISTLSVG